jgi:aminoglycoside phosphotransferase
MTFDGEAVRKQLPALSEGSAHFDRPATGVPSSAEPRSGTFSAETARSALNVVCAELAIGCDDAELIRLGQNALYRLHSQPYVVRIGRGLSHLDDAKKEVAVSEWLAEQQFPAARTAGLAHRQPLIANEYPVTVWRYIAGRTATRDDVDVLGRVLRRLHSLPAPQDYRLPELDALEQVARRVEKAAVPDSDKLFLLELCADLREQWSTLEFVLPSCVIHGDAHVQNLMMVGGAPVMLDFERSFGGRRLQFAGATSAANAGDPWNFYNQTSSWVSTDTNVLVTTCDGPNQTGTILWTEPENSAVSALVTAKNDKVTSWYTS